MLIYTCQEKPTKKGNKMLEVTIHGTITIDPQTKVETIEDLIDFMDCNHNTIHDIITELELYNDIRIVKIETTEE